MEGSSAFVRAQRELLERIATGTPLFDVLEALVRLVEAQAGGVWCSVMLADEQARRFTATIAPSLPIAYTVHLEGLEIGPQIGSCGAAAYHRAPFIVEDIATHPNWVAYRDLALPHGLRACWSTPIFSSSRELLGTFAIYYGETRAPAPAERAWVEAATHLASIAIQRDRDDRRLLRSEAKGRADEAQRALIYEAVQDIIFYVGVEGAGRYRMLAINSAYERATGLLAVDVVGKLVTEVIPPEAHAHALACYAEAIATGRPVTWEEVSTYPIGTRHGEVTLSPLFDGDGHCTNLVGTVHDVTSRRHAEAEREQLHAKLSQSQRLQSLGTLAGGVAHDFNNMLTVILSYAELVLRDLQPHEPIRADVEEIRNAAVRATELTRQLLAFGRKQVLAPRVLDLDQALTRMTRMLQRLLGADVSLTYLPGTDLANVKADPGQLEQIVMNLAVNARDAMPTGGKLTIETENAVLDDDYAQHHVDVRPGRYVMLAVTDTGVGMDEATQGRIFEPFFTTKEKGKGTGLGLSTVFGIVKQSDGHIGVHSEPGRGSAFKIYLPAVDEPVEVAAPAVEATGLERAGETILLVEDDDQVRNLAKGVLRRQGYVVLEAANAGEAMLIAEQHEARIDLLLTDVVMPRMSGRQLVDRVRPLRRDMRVLYMSGYTDDAVLQHGVLDPGVYFLQKPLTPTALLRKVREVLAAELP